jgi:hypothetical protein
MRSLTTALLTSAAIAQINYDTVPLYLRTTQAAEDIATNIVDPHNR